MRGSVVYYKHNLKLCLPQHSYCCSYPAASTLIVRAKGSVVNNMLTYENATAGRMSQINVKESNSGHVRFSCFPSPHWKAVWHCAEQASPGLASPAVWLCKPSLEKWDEPSLLHGYTGETFLCLIILKALAQTQKWVWVGFFPSATTAREREWKSCILW